MADDTDQQVALADMPLEDRRALPHDDPVLNDYADQVNDSSGLPPGLVNAVKNAGEQSESTGSRSLSPKGAKGVMQFIPTTAKRFGLTDPTDPLSSIDAAGKYLSHIKDTIGSDDPELIAAGYNAGENRKDIRAGRIPLIPETQKYAARVSDYMTGGGRQEVDPADNPDNAGPDDHQPVSLGDLPQADLQQAVSPTGPEVHSTPAQAATHREMYNPLGKNFGYDVGPRTANFLAAMDRGVSDPVVGTYQRVREALNKVYGSIPGTSEPLFDMSQSYRNNKNREAYDAPLLRSGTGVAGYTVGAGLDAALAAGLTGGLGGSELASVGSGGLSGLSMPTSNAEDSLKNGLVGAALGPLSQVAGRGLGKVADMPAVRPVVDKIQSALNTAGHGPLSWLGLLRPSLSSQLTAPQGAAVKEALSSGVPVWERQLTKPGFELTPGQLAEQHEGFDTALSHSIGQNTPDLQSAWMNAKSDMGTQYNKLFADKTIPLDFQHMGEIGELSARNSARAPRFGPNPEVQTALENAWDAAEQAPHIDGRDYQQIMREYNAMAGRLFHGTATSPSDPYSAKIITDLAGSLENQAGNVMSKDELAQFKRLNSQWRNLTQLQSIVPKDLEGNVNPRKLAAKLGSVRPDEFIYGRGDQTLPNLAKFGSTYMDLSKPPKQGFWPSTKRLVGKMAPYAAMSAGEGLVTGAMIGNDNSSIPGKVGEALAFGVPAGVAWQLYRRGAAGPRLSLSSLNAPRGGLGQTAQGMVSPGALTRLIEAEHANGDE